MTSFNPALVRRDVPKPEVYTPVAASFTRAAPRLVDGSTKPAVLVVATSVRFMTLLNSARIIRLMPSLRRKTRAMLASSWGRRWLRKSL